ncbi:MAG TPA: hypothetical protein VK395_02100 [Gemmataceae bacterium]|nr:hypothetical protein [Gemmataceae bacterium]
MAGNLGRPRINIRFRYNFATGEVEEFLIDDNAPDRSEAYHDQVAQAVAGLLTRNPEIIDAGPRGELVRARTVERIDSPAQTEEEKKETQTQ